MKKGFSLIELLVSIVILSVVMIFVSTFVLNIRDENGNIALNIPVLIDQAAISKVLNNDANILGISDFELVLETLNITYNNGNTGTIEINNDTLVYSVDGDVMLTRTLKNGEFINMTTSIETIGDNKKLYKYIIYVSSGENIEVYFYG